MKVNRESGYLIVFPAVHVSKNVLQTPLASG